MSKGLALTRAVYNDTNEIFFFIEDSNGTTIPIKQTFVSSHKGQVRVQIEAGKAVTILRGELMTKAKQ